MTNAITNLATNLARHQSVRSAKELSAEQQDPLARTKFAIRNPVKMTEGHINATGTLGCA